MQAAGLDVSRTSLVVSRQCITPGTEGVYTAGCLVGCSLWLSGDAERKRASSELTRSKSGEAPWLGRSAHVMIGFYLTLNRVRK